MRVISQNGMIDVPYERFIISVNMQEQSEIIAWTGNHISDDECIVMASYSTKEKAIKAMEMLRDTYLSRMELDGGYDAVNGCYVQPNYWVLPKVFQFPQDDEIEV